MKESLILRHTCAHFSIHLSSLGLGLFDFSSSLASYHIMVDHPMLNFLLLELLTQLRGGGVNQLLLCLNNFHNFNLSPSDLQNYTTYRQHK
jgi:hypothetical protein